ncbi:MAG: phosphatidylglycerophosphatase A family protein [Nanobdellota archaeon]
MFIELATFGALGSYMPAPAILGVLLGFAWFVYLSRYQFKHWIYGGQILVAFIVTHFAGLVLGDSHSIILDEFVAIPLVFLGIKLRKDTGSLVTSVLGVGLFGFFDLFKPLGISYLELLPGGIVLDDIGAALLACGSLWLVLKMYQRVNARAQSTV